MPMFRERYRHRSCTEPQDWLCGIAGAVALYLMLMLAALFQ